MHVTSCPFSRRVSTRFDPMNPTPPVTKLCGISNSTGFQTFVVLNKFNTRIRTQLLISSIRTGLIEDWIIEGINIVVFLHLCKTNILMIFFLQYQSEILEHKLTYSLWRDIRLHVLLACYTHAIYQKVYHFS